MTTKDVSTKSAAVNSMEVDWELARSLLGGTRAMRQAGQKYLPRWPSEEKVDYDARLKTAVLFPAYQRTVETLTGKPFSQPITQNEDIPAAIREMLKDVDREGRNLDSFAADIMQDAIGLGEGVILVEFPEAAKAGVVPNAAGVTTKEAEDKAGLRPYMVQIRPEQILGWRQERIGGVMRLSQFRFMECVEENDEDGFNTTFVDQVRVLEVGSWTTYRKQRNAQGVDQWVEYESGVTTLDVIPIVIAYGFRKSFMVSKPPLIEVAHLNVSHWQSASDQQTILHVARVPILAVLGVEDDKWVLSVGASAAVKLPPDGDMKFVEHSGAAIGAGATDLDKIEERMRQAGAELLVIKGGQITATQTNTENAVGMCALQRIVKGLEDALNQALDLMAKWSGEAQGGTVSIFNDFGALTLDAASAALVKDMAAAGQISNETAFEEQKRRGTISGDRTWEEEQARLDAQGPALGEMGLEGEPLPVKKAPAKAE